MIQNLVIDFDSTIVKAEMMEMLFDIALATRSDKSQILSQIKEITNKGMTGQIPFSESLARRVDLLPLNKEIMRKTINVLKDLILPSFKSNINELQKFNLYVVSGGFKNLIAPILADLGIKPEQIYANEFIFEQDECIGIDKKNPLAQDMGKVKVAKSLNLQGVTVCVGDGYTDYEIKKHGLAKYYFYFAQVVEREDVMKLADDILYSFDDLSEKIMLYNLALSEKKNN